MFYETLAEPRRETGFTLIEVVVAMVLVSMLTLILALALRMALQTWERGNLEGDALQLKAVLPSVMERQLSMAVSRITLTGDVTVLSQTDPGGSSGKAAPAKRLDATKGALTTLPFIGEKEHLSFFTRYAPQGAASKGLIRVSYRYDADDETLTVYERIIGNLDDLEASESLGQGGSKKRDGHDAPVAVIHPVPLFSLSFSADDQRGASGRGSRSGSGEGALDLKGFEERWRTESALPDYMVLMFAQTSKDRQNETRWLFRVGGRLF